MVDTYTIYGWQVSPYTQKVVAYLRYKGIPHREVAPGIFKLGREIPRHVGRAVMPTVETPDGDWWQDSSEIIDHFEKRYPDKPVYPRSPKQKIVANLLELHGDEWLCMSALHYRWTVPENYRFAIDEFGRNSLPWGPGFLQRMIGERLSKQMRGYLPKLGVTGAAAKGLETYTVNLLQLLEQHFQQHDFVLGNRPCIGDFSLYGPLWAHLCRDPGTTVMFDNCPAIRAWFKRLQEPDEKVTGDFLDDDQIPDTLEPILSGIFAEQFEFCRTVVDAVDRYVEENPGATRVSRIVGEGEFRVGGETGSRIQISFLQWMVQRSVSAWEGVPHEARDDVAGWLAGIGGENFMNTRIRHSLKRESYKEVLA